MTVCSPLVCALKFLAACGPEFHSVRPAAAFVAIVNKPQFLFSAAARFWAELRHLSPVLADKRTLAVATATVRKLNILQDKDR
jgi:hypothetical protein